MSESFVVHSTFSDYTVRFVDLISHPLAGYLGNGDVVMVDDRIAELYPNLMTDLPKSCRIQLIDPSEKVKEYAALIPLMDELIRSGFRKNYSLLAVGGGIVQDITAFIASILYRGVEWKFIPTTLLA